MNITDFLIRGLLKKENIRFSFADTTATVSKGIKIHDTDPAASKVFAEALTSAALLSPLLQGFEKYSLRWEYPHGEVQGILADVSASGNVRGLIKQPHLMDKTSKEDDIFGRESGFIAVTKSANGKILNSGKTRAGLANPAADAAFFFSVSDQIETEISIGIDFNPNPANPVKCCRGLMLQALPDCDLNLFETYRNRLNSDEFRKLLLSEMPIEKLLWSLLAFAAGKEKCAPDHKNMSYEFAASPGFTCTCSKDKMKQALATLGKEDLIQIFNQNENSPQITCQFCRKQYSFKKEELEDLFK